MTPKEARTFCEHRDGPGCQMAPGKKRSDGNPCAGQIVLDHIDGDRENNPPDASNYQNLCRGHNARKAKKPETRIFGVGKYENFKKLRHSRMRRGMGVRSISAELLKSEEAKPKVREWILREIGKHGKVSVEEARNSGAFISGVKQTTVQNYIDALTSKAGPLRRDFEGDEEYLYLKGKQ